MHFEDHHIVEFIVIFDLEISAIVIQNTLFFDKRKYIWLKYKKNKTTNTNVSLYTKTIERIDYETKS